MKSMNNSKEVRKNRRQFPVNKKKNAEKLNNESNPSSNDNIENKRDQEASDPLVKIPSRKAVIWLILRKFERFINKHSRKS
jgi:hypothetical protein